MSDAQALPLTAVGTLIAAVIAACASIIGVVINTVVLTNKHRRDALTQIANRRFEWVKELRIAVAQYATATYDLLDARNTGDKKNEAVAHTKMYESFHHISLLQKPADRLQIDQWHNLLMETIRKGDLSAASKMLYDFGDIIATKIDPELAKAERELQGKFGEF